MNNIDKPSKKELVNFFMDYISRHRFFKIRNIVKKYMKNQPIIENTKIRMDTRRSLAVRFSVLNKRARQLNIIKKDSRILYKVISEPYVLSKLTLKNCF